MPRRALATLAIPAALVAVAALPASAGAYAVSGPSSVNEAAGTATYTVTSQLLDPSQATVTVTGSGSAPATPGQDVGAPNPVQLTFAGVGDNKTVQVPITNDTLDEPNETFSLTVVGSGQSTGTAATTTIVDDDITVDAAPAAITEGGTASLVLTPRAAGTREVRVDYATVPGSATLADFTPAQGTVTWAAGDTTPKTIAIATTQDALDEDDETLGVLLASATDTVAAPAVPVTITDDDPPPLLGAVSTKTNEGDTGTKAVQVLVALAHASGRAVRVPFHTRDASARAPADYTATGGTLTFNPGETAKAVTVRVAGDRIAESDETFSLVLDAPENATLLPGGAAATVTIADNEAGTGDVRPPRLALAGLRARGSVVTTTVRCPAGEASCRGTLTLFSVAQPRSPVPDLRQERRLARASYRLGADATRRVTLRLRRGDVQLLRRAGSVRVRAYAVTTDAAGNVGTTSRSATLRFS